MTTVTVSSKGQITLPAGMRRKIGAARGAKLAIQQDGRRLILSPVKDIFAFKGFLGKTGISPEKARDLMAQAVADHVTGKTP